MDILSYNVPWMVWNVVLAILPVGIAFLYFRTKRVLYKAPLSILWFLFFPNALYVVSDMEHIVWQWPMVASFGKVLLIIQYFHLEVIGLLAFICGLYAFEIELRRFLGAKKKKLIAGYIITMNFLIGYAIVMGKIERVNSWDVFSDTDRVIRAMLTVLSNDSLVLLCILFGLFGNFFYFLFRDSVIKYVRKALKHKLLTNVR